MAVAVFLNASPKNFIAGKTTARRPRTFIAATPCVANH
jgi:hypothetical protein